MNNKLEHLYSFMNSNRHYNKELQERFYLSVVKPYDSISDKIISLLYSVVNTQSQPRIDKIAAFFKSIHRNQDSLNSFGNFVDHVNKDKTPNYKNLFHGLRTEAGWGDKTSALFAKTIFHLQNGEYSDELLVWDDAPIHISEEDDFYLPVDAVIIAIFNRMDSSKNWNFESVNKKIKEKYNPNEIEIWDDLWFWGFITQSGSGDSRKHEWNLNKYWALKESDKDADMIKEIHLKSQIFLRILD